MNRHIPPVSKYMTPMPYTIEANETLAQASALMQEYRIRHLPVQSASKTVGVLSLQDVSLLATFNSVNLNTTPVAAAMMRNPYFVNPETALDLVASHMLEHGMGSALIIQEDGTLVGIFTQADALKALAEILRR